MSKNLHCYIAGKISGLEKEVYQYNFEQAKKLVAELGYIPVSPLDLPHTTEGKSWEELLREDIKVMLDCGFLYALENWKDSKGAVIEVSLADKLGIHVMYA